MRTQTVNTSLGMMTVWDNFPSAEIPMYAHKAVTDADGNITFRVGETVFVKRVQDKRHLTRSEQMWLAEKASNYRWFPYPPDECMEHEWSPIINREGHLKRLPPRLGCDECARRVASPDEKPMDEVAEDPRPPSVVSVTPPEAEGGAEATATPPATGLGPACPFCGQTMKAKTIDTGKRALKRHLKTCKG